MRRLVQLAGLGLSGLLAGNELGTLIGSHPALKQLPQRSEIEAERALNAHLGRIMPIYMSATLAATISAAFDRRGEQGLPLAVAAAGCTAAMLATTLIGNLPLNRRTTSFPLDGDPARWADIRRRWERLHVARVALDLTAFGCLAVALARDA